MMKVMRKIAAKLKTLSLGIYLPKGLQEPSLKCFPLEPWWAQLV